MKKEIKKLMDELDAELMIPKGKGDHVPPFFGQSFNNPDQRTFTVEKVKEREKGPTTLTMKPDQVVTEDVEYVIEAIETIMGATDLFGQQLPAIEIFDQPVIAGQDIINIRALTGKRKDEAIKALNAATVEMMDQASPECFYIPGNVASSKNGKNPVTVRNYSKKTGRAQEFTTLVPSAVTKRYIKDTKAAWLQNKVAFLNQTRNLPIPLRVEFTFIRDSLRGFDFINVAQVLMDLMGVKKGYGWIPDDETVHIVPVFNPTVFYHKELAGVLIRIIK